MSQLPVTATPGRPIYVDFRPVTIAAVEPRGPYWIVCTRCHMVRTVNTIIQAVILREVHKHTYRHTHPDVTRPFSE